ncbi:MAG: hypothetical protein EOO43_22140 [Flavobacterium sp.]|nr:MAG: hypothetical protein EOO43_22140 [Flavobacterium sp.]
MSNHSNTEVVNALEKVAKIVKQCGNENDINYFEYHKGRYLRMAQTLYKDKRPEGVSVLNMGSHYLHVSLLFKFLGYEVHSMDVSEFWELDFVKSRAEMYGLNSIIDNNFETLKSMEGINSKYDIMLFTEILEHITFNPILFWQKVYHIMKATGVIYISTPNSLCLANIIRSIARILTFRGIGLPVNEIFRTVTYGHHWKEYSSSEIQRYFARMSDDFNVTIKRYHYKKTQITSVLTALTAFLNFIGNHIFLGDDIEAMVKIEKKGSWKIEPPKY